MVGVKDLVVVSTSDAVMVVPRSRAQEVRELVTNSRPQRPEATDHKRVHRPWGYYESIDLGERFQVKRIVVIPGGILSLQKHRHRAEHWVVVRGTAEVTIGEQSEPCTKTSPSISRSAPSTGWRTREKSRLN